jgi:hypothetical protein
MAVGTRAVMTERYRSRLATQLRQNVRKICKFTFRTHHHHTWIFNHAGNQTYFIHAVLGFSRDRKKVVPGHVDHAHRVGIGRGAGNRGERDLSTGTRLVQHDELGLSIESFFDERQ